MAVHSALMIDDHRLLLADEARTSAYRDAIARVVKAGDVVIDLGCGSGILSFFAAQAGAAHVFAIEKSHMADVAALMVRHLGLAGRVTVLHQDSMDVELPEPADVLITETMGTTGLDEQMTGYVLDARKRLLREDARIIPEAISVLAVPVSLAEEHERRIGWWSEPRYGLDLSPARTFAASSLAHVRLHSGAHLALPAIILALDLRTFDDTVLAGRTTFRTSRAETVHGFGVWFEARLASGISIDGLPRPGGSWRQTWLPLDEPIAADEGAPVDLSIETSNGRIWRWRGSVGSTAFDQTNLFAMPPCTMTSAPTT